MEMTDHKATLSANAPPAMTVKIKNGNACDGSFEAVGEQL